MKHRLLLVTFALVLQAAASFGTDLYTQDFDGGDGGIFPGGTNPSWAHGVPTSGPGVAHSGTSCWATSLSGNYNNNEDGYVTSPGIDLSAHNGGGPILFSWWQFIRTENLLDFASLEISTDGGGIWERVYGEVTGSAAPAWRREFVMLGASAAVSTFRYRFRLRSNSSNSRAGFYLDTIRVISLNSMSIYSQDFEGSDGGYTTTGASSSWEHGPPVSGPTSAFSGDKAWGTSLNAFYNSNEDSALVSPVIDLSAHSGKAFLLSWQQYLSTEADFDLASVEARRSPADPWIRVYGEASGAVSVDWTRKAAILGPLFATSTTQLRFKLVADSFFENSGFYVDDIALHTMDGAATPTITWPDPAPIAAGTPLGATQLNASASVAGTFSYSPGTGIALAPGAGQILTATFTPDDLLTYAPVISTVMIDVTGGSGYDAWRPFPPGTPAVLSAPEGDYDNDTLSNFEEYVFVTDALSPIRVGEPRLVVLDEGGTDYLGLEFSARSDDPSLAYAIETSGVLASWSASALTFNGASWTLAAGEVVLVSAQQTSPGIWLIRVRETTSLASAARKFLRVTASM